MAGNSSRKGAVRASKKGPTGGSGGTNKKRLAGKGPTPKAEDRPYHAAAKRKKAASKDTRTRAPRVKSERPKGGGELVAGRNAVVEALRAGVPAIELIVARSIDVDDRITESLQLALSMHLPIREVHRAEVEGLSGSSQGILLAIKPFQYSSFEEIMIRATEPKLIVALDGVTDPRNLGAVVRSAAAFGAHGVVMTERRAAAMTASAWKSSAGAAARLPIAQVTNLARTIDAAKKAGCFVIGLDGESEQTLTMMKVASESLMIVVGSEGKGLSRLVSEKCDLVVSIPMNSSTESLNASVATSIALFWVDEQRRK
ncbi:MAG: 23S rRNA (guanosine(2251)-2'-O)-methyltransferase RlmB [Actinobacteria bacterium]|nr:23S rRNA (guanosine(2251)-2'-O)-methyltransferase RlmB [Actinomycetota bacterium]MSW47201.1 23S rRNA (guanosine(2251)-2'-O)-methyltransferase RlmB [Actinomycetota bacterium]MSX24254.1 23S rRNA (guanosine(2251)-2'-O)-methyltransferase RlmB [Actinomycetota bacterium]MSY46871.1 23S rRNA (guanosine(2251)-2'-O)-methyltransferase RlmB [Actinomycetota bacterium]MSY56687.1 23S rRNA (guanosine(2251)-2'-O)-methyltransferase RlmB [Actinomycetota bacterium]